MKRFHRPLIGMALCPLVLVLVSCVGAADPPKAAAIVCHTAYRVSQSEPLTPEDTMRFDDEDATQSIPYIYLELHGQYSTGKTDGERALRLWVTPSGEEQVIVSQLFQLPPDSGPSDQFNGGHGFTGLTYAYDPASGAELQYWCEAE